MVTKLQRRVTNKQKRRTTLRRKLHLLRTRTSNKSVKRCSIILDALLYIHKLKIKLQEIQKEFQNLMAIKNEYLNLMKQIEVPKVKVERTGEGFVVRVMCKKGGDKLVSVLEALDEMGLNVVHARVSCNNLFAMEAIAEAQDPEATDAKEVKEALLKTIEKQSGEEALSVAVP